LPQDRIAAAQPVWLKVLDHVIVMEDTVFSFADSGLPDDLELACLAPGDGSAAGKPVRRTD
jgi:hypothetical protein